MAKRPGWVYFIQAGIGGPVKIGYTEDDPRLRLVELQTGNHEELSLRGAVRGDRALEAKLHRRWKRERLRGEWFKPHWDLLAHANLLLEEGVAWGDDLPRSGESAGSWRRRLAAREVVLDA